MRDHIRTCHRVDFIECKICGKQMKPQCIYQHMKFVHSKVRNFHCKLCPASFKTNEKLTRHKNTHDKKFNCELCTRIFASKYELTEHTQVHNNPDFFKCSVCQKSFATRTSLNIHSKLHKGMDKNLECPHCPFKTHRQQSLKYHLTTHERRNEKLKTKCNWLKCDICGALLKNKTTLWGHHNKVHCAEKFQCDLCGICAKTKHAMKIHMENKHLMK